MDKDKRLAFSAAYQSFLGAVERLGKHPYNVLHHPERDAKLEEVADRLDTLVSAAHDFDGKTQLSKVTPLRPGPGTKKDAE